MALTKTDRVFSRKNRRGQVVQLHREHYLREDIPCCSQLCAVCPQGTVASTRLCNDVTGGQCVQDYLEVFELGCLHGVIFLQSVLQKLHDQGPKRARQRVRKIVEDPRRQCAIFSNENFAATYVPPREGVSVHHRERLSTAALWYFNHLKGAMPIVITLADELTSGEGEGDVETLQQLVAESGGGVIVMKFGEYLQKYWKGETEAYNLYVAVREGLVLAKEGQTEQKASDGGKRYPTHKPLEVLEAGVKSGLYVQGTLRVDQHRAQREAWLQLGDHVTVKDAVGATRVLIKGMEDRNRAVHGDVVCVELLPKSQWASAADTNVLAYEEDPDGMDEGIGEETLAGAQKTGAHDGREAVPTGRVVGIVQRNWRPYTACLPQQETQPGTASGGLQRVLAVPMDIRIPKVRISTRQAHLLATTRFVVVIDGWDATSQYPHGHFVKTLGGLGDIETETASVLVEYDIHVPPFSATQLAELPVDTPENPWVMDIAKRRDLRNSHVIFSVDPLGSQDVDDALSVQRLPNWHTELGVHIADVSHFVTPFSLTDLEARARGTTVYLPDRRYDMLPAVLSERLCSLREEVDRFAFSVLWELDADANVVNIWMGKTVIRSAHELHYEFAQAIFDAVQSDQELISQNRIMSKMLPAQAQQRLLMLRERIGMLIHTARKLRQKRLADGALELESEEVRFRIEKKTARPDGSMGYDVKDVIPKQTLEIHGTIAECMIFANHHVAARLVDRLPHSALLRHHPLPSAAHFATLIECAAAKGFTVDVSSNRALADSLNHCVDPSDPLFNRIIRSLATQAMAEAAYFSTGSVAATEYFHYGLALPLYTHFTSPIRRYADLIVHRELAAVLDEQKNVTGAQKQENAELQKLCQHLNIKHRNSKNAQKDASDFYRCLYFKSHPNTTDDGVVVSIRQNGVIVYVPRYGFKGPVYLRDKDGNVALPDDPSIGTGSTEPANHISASQFAITATDAKGRTLTLSLFDHVTVCMVLLESQAHRDALRLQLVRIGRRSAGPSQPSTLKDMVAAAKRNEAAALTAATLDVAAPEQDLLCFKQTAQDKSLYSLIEDLRDMSLADHGQ